MEILSIIPARGGSKGIPGKNIKDLAGKPLIAYSILESKRSKFITRTVLSTEDEYIKNIAIQYGAEVIDRPMHLAQDETKTAPVLLQVLEYLEKHENYIPDTVILLQPTCPLRTANEIDEAFNLYYESDCDSVFAAQYAMKSHAMWKEQHDNSIECLYDYRQRPRRQDESEHYNLYWETGSIYIIKTEVMKKVKDFIGERPKLYLPKGSIDIDTVEDFERAERIIEKRNSQNITFKQPHLS